MNRADHAVKTSHMPRCGVIRRHFFLAINITHAMKYTAAHIRKTSSIDWRDGTWIEPGYTKTERKNGLAGRGGGGVSPCPDPSELVQQQLRLLIYDARTKGTIVHIVDCEYTTVPTS